MHETLHILILEDQPADAELAMRELRKAGFEFVAKTVTTEGEFLAELRDYAPELILADYSLPGYHGLSALAAAQKECPATPFIFVSGTLGEERAIETLHLGATDYVLKQRLARLGPAVHRALRKREERRKGEQPEQQRHEAEARLRKQKRTLRSEPGGPMSTMDMQRLVHELQIHQIELETQNEKLSRAMAQAEAATDKFSDLYDFAPAGYLTLDREGTIRQVNLIGARLLGLERGRLLHQHLVPLVAKADRLAFSAFLESVFEGQTKKSCEVTVPREGSPPLVVQIECMRSAEGQECRAVLFDITEGKQAEESLRLFRTLVDRSSDAIEVLDPETGRFLDVNERGCRDLGYSREELLALSVFDVDPKVQQSAFTKIMQELRKSSVLMWQSIHRRKDGSTFPVEVNLKYIQLDRAYVVTVVRDVTERKQAEAALLIARTRQTLLGDILRVSLEHTPLELKLAKVLDLLLAVPELSLQRKGAIFLMEAGTLVMKAHRNASEAVLTACARVPLGKCLCGRAAASGRIEFCGELDERHEIRYDGIEPHGHYCVPIGSGDQISGVIALYLASGHKREERAEQFLMAAADALSGMIEHQRGEEAVRQSEEHFRAMFEVASIGMASADPQTGRFVRVNLKMCAITGYSAAELLHLRVSEITHPDDRQKDWEVFQRVVRGEIPDYHLEKRYVRKDGAVAWVNVNMTVIRDAAGQPERTMATIEDITERRRAEESHTRLTTAIEQSAETTMITDPNSTILYVNPAFEKTSGYTREEAIGHNPRFLKSGKHDAEFYRQIWAVLGRGDVWSGRLINKKKDGTLYEEDASISPIRDAAGKVVNYVAVKRDVTHEAQLEAQLRQAQKMEAVGQLAGGVAHDFNNMLAVIRGNAELLLMNEAQHTPQTREGLKHVVAASERAANLTRQLLAFSRKQVLQLQPVLLNTIIANLTKMLHWVLRENIDLQCHYAAPLPYVQADLGMMEQVILNLVVNARDAMPEGGQLRVATEQARLDEARARVNPEARVGEFVCLRVSDTGTGIVPEVSPRIFEPFFTTKEIG